MLRVRGLHKSFGGRVLLDGAELHVRPGDRVGLVGRNGSGKSTLLRILAGEEPHDDGEILLRKGARLGYLRQEVPSGTHLTVLDEASTALEPIREQERTLRGIEAQIAALGARGEDIPEALAGRYDELHHRFAESGGFEAEARLQATLLGLGIGHERWSVPVDTLSGGWRMRVELAKLLVARPEVLLLDEPTNHLDLPSIAWFEGILQDYPGAVVVVSHDRTFLDRHVNRITEIEGSRLTCYTGNYTAFLAQKAQRGELDAARRENLEQRIRHMERFVTRFGAKATKARQANSRKKALEKLREERDGIETQRTQRTMRLALAAPVRSGDLVLRLEDVAKSYGTHAIYRSLCLEIRRGERIALVGPNGAGKSTLLRVAAGALAIDGGTRELGHNVTTAYYAQHQLDALDASRTVLGELEANAPIEDLPRLRTILGAFLFTKDEVEKRIRVLSGGEKARVALAKLLLARANFLVLDEPTNHLDLEAREVLTDALDDYGGTMLFSSHDRTLIHALATRVLEITPGEDEARVRDFTGGYEEYAAHLEGGRPDAAEPPPPAGAAKASASRRKPAIDRERDRAARRLVQQVARLEEQIESAESALERIGWLTADPEVVRDGERMRALSIERSELEAERDRLYRDWESVAAELDSTPDAAGS